jgi:hypothetical protein
MSDDNKEQIVLPGNVVTVSGGDLTLADLARLQDYVQKHAMVPGNTSVIGLPPEAEIKVVPTTINEAVLDPVFVSKVNVALKMLTGMANLLSSLFSAVDAGGTKCAAELLSAMAGLWRGHGDSVVCVTAGLPSQFRVVVCERCGVFWLASEVYEWGDLRTSADAAAEGPVCECRNCSVALKKAKA